MKTQVLTVITIVTIGTAAVVSFCLPKPAKKGLHHPAAVMTPNSTIRKSIAGLPDNPATVHPKVNVASAVRRPYDPKREARDNKYEQLLEKGDKSLAANPALAERYYQKAFALITYRPDAWLGLARAMDAQGKSVQALAAYRQAFNPPSGSGLYSSFPCDVASFARYGALCAENGQQEEAMKIYHQAGDRLNPKPDVPLGADDFSSQQLRARLEMVRGIALAESKEHSGQDRDKEALRAFKKAAQEQPDDALVQFYLGYGLRKAGQFVEAQTAFQKAAQRDTEGTVKSASEENLRAVQAHQK